MKNDIMDRMLQKLMEQEKRLVAEQLAQCQDVEIKLSPKIDVEELLRNGCITADDYEKSHQTLLYVLAKDIDVLYFHQASL